MELLVFLPPNLGRPSRQGRWLSCPVSGNMADDVYECLNGGIELEGSSRMGPLSTVEADEVMVSCLGMKSWEAELFNCDERPSSRREAPCHTG
jgi:hypothetical protein